MKKIFILIIFVGNLSYSYSQNNIFLDNFSGYNLDKIDGQNGWSTATPSTGNGSGSCVGPSCIYVGIVSKTMTFPNFGSSTKALNPVDGTLATSDGPGKSLGTPVTTGNVYVAMLVNLSTPGASTGPTGTKQLVRFMDQSFTVASRIYIKQSSGGGSFQVGVDKNGSSTNFSTQTYSYNQDHLIILKYQFNSASSTDDVAAVFVDPDLSQAEPTPVVSFTGTADATTITRIVYPWNVSTLIPNGYIGIVSVAKEWSVTSLPICGVNNIQLVKTKSSLATITWNATNCDKILSFKVQQSSNRVDFTDVSELLSDGDRKYTQDIKLINGMNFIRLLTTTKNGEKLYSNILNLKSGDIIIKDVELYPNPATNELYFNISSVTNKNLGIEIYNADGKTLLNKSINISAGENINSINISQLKAGNYFLNIKDANGNLQTKNFIKL